VAHAYPIITRMAESRPEEAVVASRYNFRVVTTGQGFVSVSEHPTCMVRGPVEMCILTTRCVISMKFQGPSHRGPVTVSLDLCVAVCLCERPFQELEEGCLCENLNPYKSVPKSKVSPWTLTRLPLKYDGGLRLVGSPCRACSSHSIQYGRLPTKLPLFGLHVPPSLSQRELLGSLCPVHPSFPTCMSAAAVRCCTCSPCQSTQNRSYCTCSFQENVMACELLLAHEIGGGVHLFRAPAAVGLVHTICQVRQGRWRWSSLDGAGSDWRFS